MAKRQPRCDLELTAYRHQTKLAIVAHPDRWLVGSQKSLYCRILIVVWADTDFVFTSHDSPVRHAERCSDSRDHPAIIIFGRTSGADHWIDAIDWLLGQSLLAAAEIKSETHRDNHGDDRDRSSRLNRNEHNQFTPPVEQELLWAAIKRYCLRFVQQLLHHVQITIHC